MPKNIKASFVASSLFLLNLDKVLRSMPALLAKLAVLRAKKIKVRSC
jgi:hypothetical protein